MLLVKRCFTWNAARGSWVMLKYGTLCKEEVAKRFDLPASVKRIWVSLYDRPGVDRWPVRIEHDKHSYDVYSVLVLAHENALSTAVSADDFDKLLSRVWKRVGNRIIYAGVRYERERNER